MYWHPTGVLWADLAATAMGEMHAMSVAEAAERAYSGHPNRTAAEEHFRAIQQRNRSAGGLTAFAISLISGELVVTMKTINPPLAAAGEPFARRLTKIVAPPPTIHYMQSSMCF